MCVCVCVCHGRRSFLTMRLLTLESAAASFFASFRLEMTWMMSLGHGEWTRSFGTKSNSPFFVFLSLQDKMMKKILKTIFPKLKKHSPTNLYMLYPMIQSAVLDSVERDVKSPPESHGDGHQGIITWCNNKSTEVGRLVPRESPPARKFKCFNGNFCHSNNSWCLVTTV